jgi:DNA-binding LacI/PurR family transcriptional regulator
MSTLRDVAQHAGVSVATGVIGLLVPNFENPIFPTIAEALQERTLASGYASILCTTQSAAFREVESVHMLLDRQVDGMIFVSCEMTNLSGEHDHYARLVHEGARIVFVNGALNTLDIPSVGVDERAAGEAATQHLLDLGHSRVAFAAGPAHYLPVQQKAMGWRTALSAAGLAPDGLVQYYDFSVAGGLRAGRKLLEGRDRPTAVICSNDLMAIGVLRAAAEAGISVPEELSVVGFDGIEATAWTNPPLTTIEQPIGVIAQTAVDSLRILIEEPRPLPNSYFRPNLRIRSSTAPAPTS